MTTNYTGPSSLTHALHGLSHIDFMGGFVEFQPITLEHVIDGVLWKDYLESVAFVPGLLFIVFMLYIVAVRLPYLISNRCSCCYKCDRLSAAKNRPPAIQQSRVDSTATTTTTITGRGTQQLLLLYRPYPASLVFKIVLGFFILSSLTLVALLMTYNLRVLDNINTDLKGKVETLVDFQDHASDVVRDAQSQLSQAIQTLNTLVNQSKACGGCVSQSTINNTTAARDAVGQDKATIDNIVSIISVDLHIRDYTRLIVDYKIYWITAAVVPPGLAFLLLMLLLIVTYATKNGPSGCSQRAIEYLYVILAAIPIATLICVYLYIAIADGDVLEDPYKTVLHFKRNDSDIVEYYLYCADPLAGGPLNPWLDDKYSVLVDNQKVINDFVKEVNITAHDTLYPIAFDLSTNVTNMLTFINQTRLGLSCATPHDVGVSIFNLGRDTIAPNLEFAMIVGWLLLVCMEFVMYLQARSYSPSGTAATATKETAKQQQQQQQHNFMHQFSSQNYQKIPQSAYGVSGAEGETIEDFIGVRQN